MKRVLILLAMMPIFSCVSQKKSYYPGGEGPLSVTQETPDARKNNSLLTGDIFATVNLSPKSGSKALGKGWFIKEKNGLRIEIEVQNVSLGKHGIHIHELGNCSADDAGSAGGHFNPANLSHGTTNPKTHHMGDLGNIEIDENGKGSLLVIIPEENFNPTFPNWDIIIGKSLILHEREDDLVSDPSGNSGARIACGVITPLVSFDERSE